MCKKLIVTSLVVVSCLSFNLAAKGADAPRIASWSNSKTENQDTFLLVKPGEKITFTVKAEGVHGHEWKIDTKNRKGPLGPAGSNYRRRSKQYKWREYDVQEAVTGGSFTWTVPDRKGLWKIQVRTINRDHERHTQNVISNCAKYWKKDEKDEWAKWMKDALCPSEARKEWIVSTSLVKVKPGQSIRKAIDSLPSEGGIVKLLPGTHVVKGTILIKRNNLAVVGARSAIVMHDTKLTARYARGKSGIPGGSTAASCFEVPRGGYHDITFKGFTVGKTYGYNFCMAFAADEVANFTVEDVTNQSGPRWLVAVMSDQHDPRYSRNIFIRNNVSRTCGGGLSVCFAENVHWIGNRGNCGADINRNLTHVFVYRNCVDLGAKRAFCVRGHGAVYAHIYNNVLVGGLAGVYNDGLTNCIIENNTISGVTMKKCYGGIYISPQTPRLNNIYRNNRIFGCLRGVYTDNYTRSAYNDEYRRKHYPPGFRPKVSNPCVINNVIYNCQGDGICMTSPWVRLDIRNNIIASNGGFGINCVKPREPAVIGNNNIWRNTKGNYNGCTAGLGDFSKDPLLVNPSAGDFHLKSKAGRWDPKTKKWVKDNVTSPCIDASDPKADFSREPVPNGGRVNMGAYGNTEEASKSAN